MGWHDLLTGVAITVLTVERLMLNSHLQYWSLKVLSLLGLTLVVFALPHLMSEPPISLYVATLNDPVQQQQLTTAYGFDRSLPYQYARWMQRAVTGQWGQSRFYPRQVADEIRIAVGRTLILLIWTAIMFGLWILCQRVWRRLRPQMHERSPSTTLAFFAIIPSFIIALLMRETLVWQLGWLTLAHLPTFAPNYLINPAYMALPATALAFPVFAIWLAASRQLPLTSQAPATPLRPRHLFGQWFRPFLGSFLLQVFLTEQVLSIRGLGMIGLAAFKRRDIPMIQGFLLGAGLLYILFQIILDWQTRNPSPSADQAHVTQDRLATTHSRYRLYSGLLGVLTLAAIAIWAPYLTPHNAVDIHSSDQLIGPGYRYLLGTDFLGRDILSRTLEGFRSAIPRTLLVVVMAGGLATLFLGGARGFPYALRNLAKHRVSRLDILPGFLLTFATFLIFEPHSWGLNIALVIGGLPLAIQLLSLPGPLWSRAVRLFHLGGQVLLLIAIFHLLNVVSDTALPTWGADIRFGRTYSQRNIWLLLAPVIALVWSQYCFYRLGGMILPIPLTQPSTPAPVGDAAKTARTQPES